MKFYKYTWEGEFWDVELFVLRVTSLRNDEDISWDAEGPLCKHSSFTQAFVYAITARGVHLWNLAVVQGSALVKSSQRRLERFDTGTSRSGPVSGGTFWQFFPSLLVISACLFQETNVWNIKNRRLLQVFECTHFKSKRSFSESKC